MACLSLSTLSFKYITHNQKLFERNRNKKNIQLLESKMVEPLLTGIVIGLSFVTLLGLFVAAYLQFKRGNELAF